MKYYSYKDTEFGHFIIEHGQDHHGKYTAVYYGNIITRPLASRSQKQGIQLATASLDKSLLIAEAFRILKEQENAFTIIPLKEYT